MSDDLQELRDRIAHCWTMMEELAPRLVQATTQTIRVEPIRPRVGELILKATLVQSVPVPIRAQVGMIANELRAILDALACRLAERHSQQSKNTYFPIIRKESYFAHEIKRKLRHVSQDDIETIRKLKPWDGGHPVLFKLHEADRIRKHQKLLGCSGGANLGPVSGRMENGQSMILNPALLNEVGDSQIILHANTPNMRYRVSTHISYAEEGPLCGQPVGEVLEESWGTIREIIELFA